MIRLFVGLALPPMVVQRLALLRAGVPGARWMEPETYHVTLRFIGEVAEDQAERLDRELAAITAPAFSFDIRGFGAFGGRGRHQAHTLYAAVERSEALQHLHDKVESAAVRRGLAPEGRKFSPHVTVAKLKDDRGRLEGFLHDNGLFSAGPIAVDRFLLYRSHLGRSGAHYTVEAEYPLVDAERLAGE